MAISDYLSRGTLSDVNTASNLLSAALSPAQYSVAKKTLDIAKKTLEITVQISETNNVIAEQNQKTNELALRLQERDEQLYEQILDELKKLNAHFANMK